MSPEVRRGARAPPGLQGGTGQGEQCQGQDSLCQEQLSTGRSGSEAVAAARENPGLLRLPFPVAAPPGEISCWRNTRISPRQEQVPGLPPSSGLALCCPQLLLTLWGCSCPAAPGSRRFPAWKFLPSETSVCSQQTRHSRAKCSTEPGAAAQRCIIYIFIRNSELFGRANHF